MQEPKVGDVHTGRRVAGVDLTQHQGQEVILGLVGTTGGYGLVLRKGLT